MGAVTHLDSMCVSRDGQLERVFEAGGLNEREKKLKFGTFELFCVFRKKQ